MGIPIDPKIAEACDSGQAFVNHYAATPPAEIMRGIAGIIAALDESPAKYKNTFVRLKTIYCRFWPQQRVKQM